MVRPLSDLRRRSFRRFGVSRFQGSVPKLTLFFPDNRNRVIVTYLLLDLTVKPYTPDLWCRSFWNFRGFGFWSQRFSHSLPSPTPDSRTFDLSRLGPTTQLSPTKVVTHGVLKKVHLTPSDVIGPHYFHFSFRSFGHQEFVHLHISNFRLPKF
jgi:hypothetical protein